MPEKITTLIIAYNNETGNVDVTGPLHNKILCYGLLEFAKEIIKNSKGSNIIRPEINDAVLRNLKDNKNGS